MQKFLIIFFLLYSIAAAQEKNNSQFSIQVKGGLNYLPMDEYNSQFGIYPESDRNHPGTSFSFTVHYSLSPGNYIFSGIEFIKWGVKGSSPFSKGEWDFKGYPLFIGYQHNITSGNVFYPYVSVNAAYVISTIKYSQLYVPGMAEPRIPDYKRTETGLGLDGNIGFIYSLSSVIELSSELKFRYSNGSLFTEQSKYMSVEFTGTYFNLGLRITL